MSTKDLNYYKNIDYTTNIERIEEEAGRSYMAYCAELGKFACYGIGRSQKEALINFLQEKDQFIEYLHNACEPIPEPRIQEQHKYSGFFNVRTSPIIHSKLVSQAREMDISLNLFLNQILSGAVEKKLADNIILDKIGELCGKLESHHYEVTRQLRYQSETIKNQAKWKIEYTDPYEKVA